jgi:hypothetical protein
MGSEDQAAPESSAVEDEWDDAETWADNDEVVVCSVDSYEVCESCQ